MAPALDSWLDENVPLAIPMDVAFAALAATMSSGVSPTMIMFLRSDSCYLATHASIASFTN